MVSLRDPGSVIDTENPGSRVGDSYFRGSGTSMSTAVTAGAVADVLAVRPDLSPDAVKELLTGTTYDAPPAWPTRTPQAPAAWTQRPRSPSHERQPPTPRTVRAGSSTGWTPGAAASLATQLGGTG